MTDPEINITGTLLTYPECFAEVREIITSEVFTNNQCKDVFEAIEAVVKENKTPDVILVNEKMKNKDVAFLSECSINIHTSINATETAQILKERSIRSKTLLMLENTKNTLLNGENYEVTIKPLIEQLTTQETRKNDFQDSKKIAKEAFDYFLEIQTGEKKPHLKTGIENLDEKMGGVANGEMVVIGARPSIGKTALALQVAHNMAKENKIGFFSFEMSSRAIMSRIIANTGGLNSFRLGREKLTEQELDKLGKAVSKINENLIICDRSGLEVAEFKNKAHIMKRKHGVKCIFIDYLQLMKSDRYKNNRVNEVADISDSIKSIAKDLDVPVVALSQVSRNKSGDNADTEPPSLARLKDSSAIEQDCDVALMLWRDREADDEIFKNKLDISCKKYRNGGVFNTSLNYELSTQRIK